MTEPETLALLEVKGPEAPEKSPPQTLIPNGEQPEGGSEAESPGAESLRVGSSVGSPTAREGTEDGLESTVSEAATLPWGSDPQPSAPLCDPPGWRDIEPDPLEPLTKAEELPGDDSNVLPEKVARAFVPIDLQCIERKPQEDLIVCFEAGEGKRRTFVPPRATHPEPPECKWAEAVVRPPGQSFGGCRSCRGREGLRAMASVGAALLLFPCLLYGAYAFLPFDAPRLPTMSSRLVYTLRCGVFATFPIVLGHPQAAPSAHRAVRHLQADILAVLRRGPLLPRLRLRPDVPAAAGHAGVESLLHVHGGARAHAHGLGEPPGLSGPCPRCL
ncbi:transmembrane protein 79 isoform X2 [Heterocephalus glaber]|uniref:Transmembrane protein 79 isoform X2 n=1 Tax=Heterocephalus glaber TaxID=10181 RepID=A0AAX6SAX4_HETGA|nr:transmembrane protein 79 isoform X2 [Heterocephalus glaber]